MGDEGIEGGPLLCGINLRHRMVIGCVSAEAIDGLGWKGDETTGAKTERCLGNARRICRQYAGCGRRHRARPISVERGPHLSLYACIYLWICVAVSRPALSRLPNRDMA